METLNMLLQQEWVRTLLGCVLLLLVAWLAGRLARFAVNRVMTVLSRRTA